MIDIITNKDHEICYWVGPRVGLSPDDLQPCSTLGFAKNGVFICGVVFNNFRSSSRDIHLTIAAENPTWINKGTLSAIFSYVFIQLGCIRLTLTIRRKNKRARKLAEGLGFKYEGNMRRGYDGLEDAIIYGMLHRECKWIGELHGEKYTGCT